MDQRNATTATPRGARPGSPWGRTSIRTSDPGAEPAADDRPHPGTPLVWAAGGALLTVTLWLTGMIAFFRSIAGLFS